MGQLLNFVPKARSYLTKSLHGDKTVVNSISC